MKMLKEVEEYWTRRAESYSDVVCHELNHSNEKSWMDVILKEIPEDKKIKIADMGTGPGFFAISLAKRGYDVTAVDYTQEMLNHAMQNAGTYASRITWMRGDVQNLENIQDGSFDVIVTRNLTWNLEEPQKAYQEWCRVLKKGGILLNFDAGWYNYLFDDKQKNAFEEDHRNVEDAEVFDFNAYDEAYKMEEIARNLILSRCARPTEDLRMIRRAGFCEATADREVWKKVWAQVEGQKLLDEAKKQIQAEKDSAISDIRRQVAVLSVDIAEKVLRKNLDDEKEQMEMIDRLLDELTVSKD